MATASTVDAKDAQAAVNSVASDDRGQEEEKEVVVEEPKLPSVTSMVAKMEAAIMQPAPSPQGAGHTAVQRVSVKAPAAVGMAARVEVPGEFLFYFHLLL